MAANIDQLIHKIDQLISVLQNNAGGTGGKSDSDDLSSLTRSLAQKEKLEMSYVKAKEETLKRLEKEVDLNEKLTEEEKTQQKLQIEKAKQDIAELKRLTQKHKAMTDFGGALNSQLKDKLKFELNSEKMNAKIAESLKAGDGSVKSMGKGLLAGAEGAFSLGKSIAFLEERFKVIDNDAKSIAKSLNMTFDSAQGVRDSYNQIALDSGQVYLTGEKLTKSQVQMSDALNTSAQFSKERLATYTKLRDVAKVDQDVLDETNKMSFVANQTQEQIFGNRIKSIAAAKLQNRVSLDENKVMKEMVKASAAIRLNYAGRDKEFAKATVQAAKLGMELSNMETIQQSLLNFESSIENQMSAELLIGRSFNMEQARLFALKKDFVGLGKELERQNLSAQEFNDLNYIQQQEVSKMLGMDVQQMSKMYIEAEALRGVSAKDLSDAQKKYDIAVAEGKTQEFLAKLGNEALARQFQQQSLQDRMVMAQEKMLSLFDKMAIAFRPIYKLFIGILDVITWVEEKLGGVTRLLGYAMGNKAVQKVIDFAGKSSSSSAASSTASTATTATAEATANPLSQMASRMANAAPPPSSVLTATAEAGGGAGGGVLARLLASISKGGKGFLGKLLKSGVVAPLVETWLANSDIQGMIGNKEIDNESLKQLVGQRASQGFGSLLGGIGGGALAAALAPFTGGSSLLMTAALSGLGSFAGGWLADKLAAATGAKGMGEVFLGGFFDKEMEAAGRPVLQTGGEVLSTGFAKVDAGEFYAGMNSSDTVKAIYNFSKAAAQGNAGGATSQDIKDLIAETRQQNQYLQQLVKKDTTIVMDGAKVAGAVANNVVTSYGNILNPSSRTYA